MFNLNLKMSGEKAEIRSKRPPKRPLDDDFAYEGDEDFLKIEKLKPSPLKSKRENTTVLHQELSTSFSHAKVTLESIID